LSNKAGTGRQGKNVAVPITSFKDYLPDSLKSIKGLKKQIPEIAKNAQLIADIENAIQNVPTTHLLYRGDSRFVNCVSPESIHLILTSPPYWRLKDYEPNEAQLGAIEEYEAFLDALDEVWRWCFHALVPGGRLVCVIGDVCLSRRKNNGKHIVIPLHASTQERLRKIGFNNLAPVIWYKISNANYEAKNGSSFLGKPYEPNAIIKNDIEYILMERKAGGYRSPSLESRVLSIIPERQHKKWFQQIWSDIAGASNKGHPAPFPLKIAERLVRMFSFVGDTVLDPFMGTGTTNLAAAKWGRNSIGIEVEPCYFNIANERLYHEVKNLFRNVVIETRLGVPK
jgi:DNA modification methylase